MADGIRVKAEAFCQSYAKAVNCVDPTRTGETSKAILSHYVSRGFTSFSMGSIKQLNDLDEAVSRGKSYLDRWFTLGIGLDITLEHSRIEVVSPYNALCFLTWEAHPFPQCGEKEWSFQNVYSYRVLPEQEGSSGAFEFAISDNETSSLLQRFPSF